MTYYIIDKNLNTSPPTSQQQSHLQLNTSTTINKEIKSENIEIESNYENCCKKSSWLQELNSLIELDQRYKNYYNDSNTINEHFNNLKLYDSNITSTSTSSTSTTTTTTATTTSSTSSTTTTLNNISFENILKEKNDKVIISSILSKLSYFNDKETILWYLEMIVKKSHCVEKIKKLYYFKPLHTRTKLLIGFDDEDNMYCAFQGTVNSSDLILDICCGFLEKITYTDQNGPKHSLFSACSRVEWAVSIVPELLSIANRFGKKQLIFTGHSIGGTFAMIPCLEAIKIQKQQNHLKNIELKCFTFGSPSFLHGSSKKYLDENPQCNEIFENYLNEFDIVPMMSHHPFIFIDFMYIIMCISTFIFTIGYHLTTGGIKLADKGIDQLIYNLVYPFIMLSIPLLITKLMYVIYQYFFSIGLQSKFTRVYTHSVKKYIFFENVDQDVEFSFKSIKNHVKKLINYKKLILIHDHKLESYLSHLFNHYQIGGLGGSYRENGTNGSDPSNLLTSNDIFYLQHYHPETIETTQTLRMKNKILKKGLLLLGFCHLLWLFLSIPIFYQSLYYLCLIKTQ
ncbi:hypothetical protein RB653_003645 [Dictyostelium firmibasis]|uniref:Fungal lipase-type domain-containing protein n=1 Tax=Dictyostelium firmibasis TaxID=79012 RepID=A0AAN7UHU4_9MYCE